MRKSIYLVLIMSLFFLLSSCGQSLDYGDGAPGNGDDHGVQPLADSNTPERKMIYKVDLRMRTKNLTESIDEIKSLVQSDEWFDQESVSSSRAYFLIRIKTDRLDAFIEDLSTFTIESMEKLGTDISLSYQDKTNRIVSLEAQRVRLVALYEEAELSDMIVINQQISNIDVELANLTGELNLFDSLVEYSEVRMTIIESQVMTQSPFFNRLGNAFMAGVHGLVVFFQTVAIVFATIFPFAAVFVPSGFGIAYVLRKRKAKKNIDLK